MNSKMKKSSKLKTIKMARFWSTTRIGGLSTTIFLQSLSLMMIGTPSVLQAAGIRIVLADYQSAELKQKKLSLQKTLSTLYRSPKTQNFSYHSSKMMADTELTATTVNFPTKRELSLWCSRSLNWQRDKTDLSNSWPHFSKQCRRLQIKYHLDSISSKASGTL